jgi:hypothetical protein
MSPKRLLVLFLAAAFFLALGLVIWAMAPIPAQAQCGDIPPHSSCITCHEKESPVNIQDEWHAVHASKDCCASCHGGNCVAIDKDLAHQGLVAQPLEDIYTSCYRCHPDDYQEKANQYALVLGINPGSRPTPTAVPSGPIVEHPMVISPPSIPITTIQFPSGLVFGTAILAALLLFAWVMRSTRLDT